DRYRRGRGLGRERASPATRYYNHAHPAAHEIGCQLGKSAVLAFRPAEFQRHALPFLITTLGETFAKCGHLLGPLGGGAEIEKPDHRHRRLLRARGERPCSRAAEKRDELAPLHSITSSASPSSGSGTVSPSALAVLRLMTSVYLSACWVGRSPGLAPLRMRST